MMLLTNDAILASGLRYSHQLRYKNINNNDNDNNNNLQIPPVVICPSHLFLLFKSVLTQ